MSCQRSRRRRSAAAARQGDHCGAREAEFRCASRAQTLLDMGRMRGAMGCAVAGDPYGRAPTRATSSTRRLRGGHRTVRGAPFAEVRVILPTSVDLGRHGPTARVTAVTTVPAPGSPRRRRNSASAPVADRWGDDCDYLAVFRDGGVSVDRQLRCCGVRRTLCYHPIFSSEISRPLPPRQRSTNPLLLQDKPCLRL